jgi:hypothetical protein
LYASFIDTKDPKRSEKLGEISNDRPNENDGCDLKKVDKTEEDLELGEIDEKSDTNDQTEAKEKEDTSDTDKTIETKSELSTGKKLALNQEGAGSIFVALKWSFDLNMVRDTLINELCDPRMKIITHHITITVYF